VWGEASSSDELAGDFGNSPEGVSTGNRRVFRLSAGNWLQISLGLFRQHRPDPEMPGPARDRGHPEHDDGPGTDHVDHSVHASGEWVASLWPVCYAAELSAQIKGAALTYARRYALFTLVGIAGEDDLDAPETVQPPESLHTEQPSARKPNNGSIHSSRQPTLAPDQSASLRDRLVQEISAIDTADALAQWAHRSLKLKNTLTQQDAQAVEAAYLAKLGVCSEESNASEAPSPIAELASSTQREQDLSSTITALVAPLTKPVRKRSKAHPGFCRLAAMPHLQGESLRPAPPEDRPAAIVGTKGK
jgi:ERF superfamily